MIVFSTIIRRSSAAAAAFIGTTTQRRTSFNISYTFEKPERVVDELNRYGDGKKYTTEDSLHLSAKSEISNTESYYKHFVPIKNVAPPTGFPFKIEDYPGDLTVTLTRDYHGEVIKVTAHMQQLEDEDVEKGKSSIPLVVNVSRKDGGGPSLEFSIMSYPDEISIHNLSVKIRKEPNASQDHQIVAYEGRDFTKLDEKLQKAIHKSYLEMRGITPSITNFLHEYVISKKRREHLTWLNNMKEFLANY